MEMVFTIAKGPMASNDLMLITYTKSSSKCTLVTPPSTDFYYYSTLASPDNQFILYQPSGTPSSISITGWTCNGIAGDQTWLMHDYNTAGDDGGIIT